MSLYAMIGPLPTPDLYTQLYTQFANTAGIRANYQTLISEPDRLQSTLQHFHDMGGLGVALHPSLQSAAYTLCDQLDAQAQSARAVSALCFHSDGQISGYNTLGQALIEDLHHHRLDLEDKSVLLLGGGVLAQAILPSVLAQKPLLTVVSDHHMRQNHPLTQQFEIIGCDVNQIPDTPFDVVLHLNTTSTVPLPHITLQENACVYDLSSDITTINVQAWAQAMQAPYYDGLGFWVENAALTFRCWHDIWPITSMALKQLREELMPA